MTFKVIMKNKTNIVSSIAGILVTILAVILLFNSFERQEKTDQELQEALAEMDRIVNRAVVLCEGASSVECDQLMSEWFEECKKSEMKDVPSCHDGRISNYLSNEPTTISEQTIPISEECKEFKEIMEQNRWEANNNDPIAIAEFSTAMNEYNRLGCP